MHPEPYLCSSWGLCHEVTGQGRLESPFPASECASGEWRSGLDPTKPLQPPHRLCTLSGFGGGEEGCSLLPGLYKVRKSAGTHESGPSVDGKALIHGLENPSLVICQTVPKA